MVFIRICSADRQAIMCNVMVRFSEFISFSIADVYDSKYSGQVGATTKCYLFN